jgi:hypothetical protein
MKKLLLSLFIVPLLMGAACAKQQPEEDQKLEETNINKVVQLEEQEKYSEKDTQKTTDYEYVLYENKAIGYSIMRPDGWYWQHFMKSDLEAAGSNELIDDYVVLDKSGITGLDSEYLGQIVIEKSRMSLEDLAKDKKEYASKEVTIDGQEAMRYELETDKKLIEYHFVKDGATFRLYYISNDNQENEVVFEKIVKSFSFGTTSPKKVAIDKYYCDTASDCVENTKCHPTEYINNQYGPDDAPVACTRSCEGPIDCGAGHAECQNNKCVVVAGE